MPTAKSRLGDWGEDIAGRFLESKGFQILDRKYRCAMGEIDLVARDGEELVFVEVRTSPQRQLRYRRGINHSGQDGKADSHLPPLH